MIFDVTATVVSQTALTSEYSMLRLHAPEIAAAARPGQFVHVRVPGLDTAALRRPFSICAADDAQLQLLYKRVGRGTEQMAHLQAGASLQVIGALGNGFPLQPQGTALLVAGGYGVAPLYFLARRLQTTGILFVGGRSRDDLLLESHFEALGWEVRAATEDGTHGTQGLVTVPLDACIKTLTQEGQAFELFACGPDGLLRAVGQRAIEHNMRGWLSLDKHMVCGVGACLACVQNLCRPDGTTWVGRVCHDGPIFEAREIVWSA